jgi:hypothetical protein
MATRFRASIGWAVDSLLPRDQVTINPCFSHGFDPLSINTTDWQTLADDLKTGIQGLFPSPSRQITVKLYEIKAPVSGQPNRPKATSVYGAGVFTPSAIPGELALCLSYYGGDAGPSKRGRLYVPYTVINNTTASLGARPNSADRTKVGTLVGLFAGLGGANVDWGVWSPTRNAFTKADHWYVDDEWDTVRSRGLRPTTRTAGTTSG